LNYLVVTIIGWFYTKTYGTTSLITIRGKPLEEFASIDWIYIYLNKSISSLFTFHLCSFCYFSSQIKYGLNTMTFFNTILAIPCFYLVYDFFYTLFHRVLHIRSFYGLVHKHHHRQTAPSRGFLDAINVHWFEFIVGEYHHLMTIIIVSYWIFPSGVHIIAVLFFILVGGILASLNHTRYDLSFPVLGLIYRVKYHDVHHWFPYCNYGQYSVFWDYLFGTFKPYPSTTSSLSNKTAVKTAKTEKTRFKKSS